MFALLGSVMLHTLAIVVFDFRFAIPEKESRVLHVQLVPQSSTTNTEQANPKQELDDQTVAVDSDTSNSPQELDSPPSRVMQEISVVESQSEAHFQSESNIRQAAAQESQTLTDRTALSAVAVGQNPNPKLSIQDLVSAGAAIAREQSNEQNVRNITGDDVTNTEEEYYLKAWLKKVQEIGQINYPREAVENKLYGKLRLYVSLNPDGSVKETRVIRSSGHKVLDEAAIHIVELAAPFSSFPKSMRESIDLLEIVREWEFRKETLVPATDTKED